MSTSTSSRRRSEQEPEVAGVLSCMRSWGRESGHQMILRDYLWSTVGLTAAERALYVEMGQAGRVGGGNGLL